MFAANVRGHEHDNRTFKATRAASARIVHKGNRCNPRRQPSKRQAIDRTQTASAESGAQASADIGERDQAIFGIITGPVDYASLSRGRGVSRLQRTSERILACESRIEAVCPLRIRRVHKYARRGGDQNTGHRTVLSTFAAAGERIKAQGYLTTIRSFFNRQVELIQQLQTGKSPTHYKNRAINRR